MVQQSSQPERQTTAVTPTNFDDPEPKKKSSGGLVQYIIPIGISVVIAYLMIGWLGVSKGDFTSNITSMNAKVDTTVKSLSDLVTKTNSMVVPADFTTLQTTVKSLQSTSAVNTDVNTIKSDVSVLKTDVSTAKNDINSLKSVPKVDTSSFASKSDVASINDKNNTQDTTIKTLQGTVDAQAKSITDLQAKVATLATPTPTPTPTPTGTGGTSTSGAITATVVGNAFTGTSIMTIPALAVNGNGSGSFTIQITNSGTKTLSGIQLAVGLGIFDNTNPNAPQQYTLPVSANTTLSSNGNLSIIWTAQSTGVPYVLGFVNQVNTGSFAFGSLNVGPGTSTYLQTFTLSTPLATPNLVVFPSVKVVSQGQ